MGAAKGGLLLLGGSSPPTLPFQAFNVPCQAFLLRWAVQSLALSCLLNHRKPLFAKQVKVAPRLSFPSAKQTYPLGNGDGSFKPENSIRPFPIRRALTVRFVAIALLFGGPLALFRVLLSALPPDFSQRWRVFMGEHSQNEPLASCRWEKKSSVIYDIHGEVITTVGSTCEVSCVGAGNWNSKESATPTYLWQAVVACEDRRFFQHRGVDPRGLARAALSLSSNGGGSTITQQLVKNVFLNNERKFTRKLVEMFLALILESRISKWDILRTYLKKIYWGHGNYGIEAASIFYFGKHVSLLNIGECAMLAGMIPAPEMFSPFRDANRGKRAQGRALRRMVEVGFLDTSSAEVIINEPLELTIGGEVGVQSPCKAPFFVDEVLKDLNERYGCSRVLEGGLKVFTTLDLGMQEVAEKIINERVVQIDRQQISFIELAIRQMHKKLEQLQTTRNFFVRKVTSKIFSKQGLDHGDATESVEQAVAKIDNKISLRKEALQVSIENLQKELNVATGARLEAALTAIDHSDGGVRVLVGGRDHIRSSLNWITQALRPPGSAFKPVVYLTAIAEKISTKDILWESMKDILRDDACTPDENLSHKCKEPFEKRDKVFAGLLEEPCVKLCSKVGADKVCRMGKHLGIEAPLVCDPKLALGGFKITPMELATVYSTIASGGVHHKPFFITRVETADGKILEEKQYCFLFTGYQRIYHSLYIDLSHRPSSTFRAEGTSSGVRVVEEHVVTELKKVLKVQQGVVPTMRTKLPTCIGQMVASDGHRDAWCAGFAQDITCMVWLGYDDHDCAGLHLHPGLGASHASQILKHFITLIHKDQVGRKLKSGRVLSMKFSKSLFKVRKIKRSSSKIRTQEERRAVRMQA